MQYEQDKLAFSLTVDELTEVIDTAVKASWEAFREWSRECAEKPLLKNLTTKQVHEEYGIHTKMLIYWRMLGAGPRYISLGRKVLYERNVLEKFLADRIVQTSGEWVECPKLKN